MSLLCEPQNLLGVLALLWTTSSVYPAINHVLCLFFLPSFPYCLESPVSLFFILIHLYQYFHPSQATLLYFHFYTSVKVASILFSSKKRDVLDETEDNIEIWPTTSRGLSIRLCSFRVSWQCVSVSHVCMKRGTGKGARRPGFILNSIFGHEFSHLSHSLSIEMLVLG